MKADLERMMPCGAWSFDSIAIEIVNRRCQDRGLASRERTGGLDESGLAGEAAEINLDGSREVKVRHTVQSVAGVGQEEGSRDGGSVRLEVGGAHPLHSGVEAGVVGEAEGETLEYIIGACFGFSRR
jgi:hypothetical protein